MFEWAKEIYIVSRDKGTQGLLSGGMVCSQIGIEQNNKSPYEVY